jgi:chloramphenicol 3-O phosphotransferase
MKPFAYTDPPGRAIILNGPTRVGKSSLAAELQRISPQPPLTISIDSFYCHIMLPGLAEVSRDKWKDFNWASALYATASAMVREGHDVIIDTLTVEPLTDNHLLTHFESIVTYFIGLHCPLEFIRQRMRPGQENDAKALKGAEDQFLTVHANAQHYYDLELDTSMLSTKDCAEKVLRFVTCTPEPQALSVLRAKANENRIKL